MKPFASSLATKPSWLLLAAASLFLSGCVTEVVCRYPAPPAELVEAELPPPGHFQDRLREIVTSGPPSRPSPSKPTSSSPDAGR